MKQVERATAETLAVARNSQAMGESVTGTMQGGYVSSPHKCQLMSTFFIITLLNSVF